MWKVVSTKKAVTKTQYEKKQGQCNDNQVNQKQQNNHKLLNNNRNDNNRNDTNRNDNNVYINKGFRSLNEVDPSIHSRVYNYIKTVHSEKPINEAVRIIKNIGKNRIDKILGLTNLFCYTAKLDKIDDMNFILDHIARYDKSIVSYVVNSSVRNYTPLMHSAYNLAPESVKFLLAHGADTSIRNINGEDVYSAAHAGLQNKEHLEGKCIYNTNKCAEIIQFVDFWEKQGKEELTEIDDDKFVFENDNIDTKKNIAFDVHENGEINMLFDPTSEKCYDMIETLIVQYIDDTNFSLMTKLFTQLATKIEQKVLQMIKVVELIERYREDIVHEFTDSHKLFLIFRQNK